MKQLIMDVLDDMSTGQINLESEASRKLIANTIMAAIKTNNGRKGWVLDLSTIDGGPKLDTPIYEKSDEQKARESWVCSICGENTFEVDYDYIGSGTNHLGCELKSQKEIDEYIEDIDEQAYAQGRGSSMDEMEIRRQKNWLQKKHEDKVFGKDEIKRGPDRRGGDRRTVSRDSIDLTEAKIQASSDHNDGWVKKYYEDKLSEAIVDNKEERYIYESPDGGKTVYRRKFGEDKRELMDKKEWEKRKKSSIAYNIQPTPINDYGDDDWATPTGSNVIGEIK